MKKITKGNFKVFLSTPENVFYLKTKYSRIVYEKTYYLKKFRGLKSQQYRVVALEVKMVKFKKKMTSFKNVLFYVYFDLHL